MTRNLKPTPNIREVIPAEKVTKAIKDLAGSLMARYDFSSQGVILVGIQLLGALLAKLLTEIFKKEKGVDVLLGDLDISLYRDDFSTSGIQPLIGETHLDFEIDDKKIVLVDDVLFTGRTIRAALNQIMDFGRPASVALAVLVDRGHREMPISADFAPITLSTKRSESVDLHLTELDGKDEIVIVEAGGQ